MSEYAGRIAVGVSIVLVVSVAFAFELNYFLPANVTTSSSQSTNIGTSSVVLNGTSWFGDAVPPANCGNMTSMVGGTAYGYKFQVYISPIGASGGVPLGSDVCIYTYVQNVHNSSTAPPSLESLYVTNINESNTHVPSGVIFFQGGCAVPASSSGSFGPNSTGWNCNVVWNTSRPYDGILPNVTWPDAYIAYATINMSSPSTAFVAPGSFRFATGSTNTTVTTTSSSTPYACGGPTFKLLTPTQYWPLYLKVVTDQGSVITNNGTVFVTHTVPAANGISGGTANYCLRLAGNATGYMELAANDTLPATGSFNLTLFAGYNQGPGYQGTIPSFTVQPDTTVYVTVSVPSGVVTIVSCASGNNCTTTTTTATASSRG
jgi:hypothetical protein